MHAKMQIMDWDDLRFFLAAVRGGSLARAAQELGVNHTTVGRRLDALQRQLGTVLLQQTPDGLALTLAGESIKAMCERIEADTIEVERRAAGKDRAAAGLVRITSTETFAARFVIPATQQLRRRHPEIEIEVIPDYRRLDLVRRQADIALRNVKPEEPGLIARRVAKFGFAQYASDDYLKRHPKPRRGEGLSGHDLIVWAYMRPSRSQFMGESTDGARIAFRSNSTNALVWAAICGFGIASLPCYLADPEPRLLRIWPDVPPLMDSLWLIYHEDLRRAGRIMAVAQAIAEAFHRESRLLRGDAPASPSGLSHNQPPRHSK
jgi:DNA-binding transcriptional LysR family regulator